MLSWPFPKPEKTRAYARRSQPLQQVNGMPGETSGSRRLAAGLSPPKRELLANSLGHGSLVNGSCHGGVLQGGARGIEYYDLVV